MERRNKRWFEVYASNASGKQKIEFNTITKDRLGKKNEQPFFSDIRKIIVESSASGYHTTKHSDKYDSVKKQSTGHLKDF